MSRKKIILILSLVILVIAVTMVIVVKFSRPNQVALPIVSLQPTPIFVEELITWTDPAAFSFQYPESLSLDPHEEDEENYAHVELKSATNSGNLVVWVKETTAEDITEWVRVEKIQNAIDSNLGGEEAKKVLLTGSARKIITSSIYGGYLYQIEVNPIDFNFWNRIYEQVSSSFKFIPSEISEGEKPVVSQDEGEIFEEEIIE